MGNLDWQGLVTVLGDENVDKIKSAITYEIIENLKESIRSEWIILPSDFEDMYDELGREVFEEVKKKYKKALKNVTSEKMEEFIQKMREK